MYEIRKDLTKENVLSMVNSYSIFKAYCPGFEEVGKPFKSPLRPANQPDNKPSAFIIFFNDDLLFKDFGLGGFRAISFVMERFNLGFSEALQKINCDFDLKLGGKEYIPQTKEYTVEQVDPKTLKNKPVSIIEVKRRKFEERDKEFWTGRYGIKELTLELFGVSPISHFTINDYLYFAAKLSYNYDYYWEDGIFRRKIYQPLAYNKWYSNGGLVVQGEGMLLKDGPLLFITSSLKDVMTLYEMGLTAIAPVSESTFVPEGYFVKQNERFERIVLFMDSDEAGVKANKRLSARFDLPYINIPEGFKSKDISDMVFNHGQHEAMRFMHNFELAWEE